MTYSCSKRICVAVLISWELFKYFCAHRCLPNWKADTFASQPDHKGETKYIKKYVKERDVDINIDNIL